MAKCAQEDGSAMFAPLTEAHVANFEHDRQGPIHVRIMSLSGKSPGIFWRANGVFQASSPTHSHLHSDRRQCDFTVDEHTKPPSLCLLQHGNMATWQHGYTATRQHVQLAGVDRPAICSIMPNEKGEPTYMLDLGANVDCEPHHLHQFAIMGSVLFSAMEGVKRPTIGLLNVGTEEIKGNEVVKSTGALLREDHARGKLNFYGNVEGTDIFKGTTNVVVCDGFVGNVTLKAIEGLARFVKDVLTSEFKRNPITMLGALIARGALKAITNRLNPSRYNGASLLGLRGLVIKSHGGADAYSFEWALRRAYDAAKNDVQAHLASMIAELMPRTPVAEEPTSTSSSI